MLLLDIQFFIWFMLQAAVSGLQYQPTVNVVIDGNDIIYRDHIDTSIAVGTPKIDSIPFYCT